MTIEGTLGWFWRIVAVCMSFSITAFCFYAAFYYSEGVETGFDLLLKWAVVIAAIIMGIMSFRFPFKGICAFVYDGNVLFTKNLVTGSIAKHHLTEIAKIEFVSTRGSHDIRFRDGSYIIVGIWGVSNINRLLAQLRKDIKAYKKGTYNFNISPTNQ